eukprot:CAMPEP_0114537286 /NCGR_PEP_ID=MMETSP0109-20121206/29496_1 /TAXON_ID=29199 /ORGANISM="Chlorarachnion reptans, Strain CCCM449" /LENGTH=69 /DNA_ID=CAMNT_0001721163 /DNA_START=325 /DNA_END=531 /DNA_ORIENTATION=-
MANHLHTTSELENKSSVSFDFQERGLPIFETMVARECQIRLPGGHELQLAASTCERAKCAMCHTCPWAW